jgi:hypothetical protein
MLETCQNCSDTGNPANLHTREVIIYSVGAAVILILWVLFVVCWMRALRLAEPPQTLNEPPNSQQDVPDSQQDVPAS